MDDHGDMPSPRALTASLLMLMTRYAEAPCPRLAQLIARQLHFLHLLTEDTPLLANTSTRLFGRWVSLQAGEQPQGAVH
jgi:hypothetical protein